MAIANAVQRGKVVYVYDEKGVSCKLKIPRIAK